MVATQVLISLCVAGMAVAAPQLALPGLQRTSTYTTSSVNEGQIVNNVVTALQPSIAEAVANALRSLQTTTTSVSGSSFGSSNRGSSSSSSSSRGSSASAVDSLATDAKYNFEYKVADEEAQTYISQQESRDGEQLTGTYSYVNPEGALIVVNYEAGPMGYTQTLDKQDGFVTIRSQNVGASNAGASSSSSGSSRVSSSSSSSGSRFSGSSSQSASLDQSALIAQIVSALQPQIQASVNSALASQQTTTTRQVVAAAPVPVPAPAAASGSLSSVFGDGYNVRFVTPEFNVEY